MQRIEILVPAIVAALAADAVAQCVAVTGTAQPLTPTGIYVAADEGETAEIPLGFTFPFAAASITCSHLVASSNCELYLTDGTGVVGRADLGISSLTEARGGVGGSPRVAAIGGDNWGMAPTAQVLVDLSVAGAAKVTWQDWSRYNAGQAWDVSVTLYDTGAIQFDYGDGLTGFDAFDVTCVSAGDGVGTGFEVPLDLSVAGSVPDGLVHMSSWTSPIQLASSSVRFTPNGNGFDWTTVCSQEPATHTAYGAGCYDQLTTAAAYQVFPNAASAEAALEGTSLTFTPIAGGYRISDGAAVFTPPGAGAVNLFLGDDTDAPVAPSTPFLYLGTTAVAALRVHSNGFVSMGPGNDNGAYGTAVSFNSAPVASFRSNLDLDPASGGDVVWEEVAGVLFVTYDAVFRYATSDAETFQLQFELATGVVHMVWSQLSSSSADDLLVGYSPGSPIDNPIDLATDLPFDCVESAAMSVTAAPAPVSTATGGALVTYSIADVPDATGGSGVHFGVIAVSFGGIPAGVDLGFLGAPGCRAYVTSLDLLLSFVGVGTSVNTVGLQLPAGIPPGTHLYAQAISIQEDGLLNAAGLTSSNGIDSRVGTY